MRPSTSRRPSLSSGLAEILCALGNICYSETPDKESFFRVAKFYKIDGEILEAEQKNVCEFSSCAWIRLHDCFRNAGYNARELSTTVFDMFPEFSNVVHILAVIPATSCSAERPFSALRRLKTYLPSTMGQQRVSNTALAY